MVIDFKGVGPQHTSTEFLRLFRSYANQFNLNYPEFMSSCFVINAPYFVVGLWSVIKHWLDPRTAAKVGCPTLTRAPNHLPPPADYRPPPPSPPRSTSSAVSRPTTRSSSGAASSSMSP